MSCGKTDVIRLTIEYRVGQRDKPIKSCGDDADLDTVQRLNMIHEAVRSTGKLRNDRANGTGERCKKPRHRAAMIWWRHQDDTTQMWRRPVGQCEAYNDRAHAVRNEMYPAPVLRGFVEDRTESTGMASE